MRSLVSLGCALFLLHSVLLAQVKIIGEVPPTPPPTHAQVTVSDVIKMSNAGLADEMIIQQIQKNAQPFDLSPDQLVRLKQNNVSERVIRAMMPAPPPSSASTAPTATAATPAIPSEYPTEVGVYAKEHSQWREVLPEIVNWKSGGVLKSTVTIGVTSVTRPASVPSAKSSPRLPPRWRRPERTSALGEPASGGSGRYTA